MTHTQQMLATHPRDFDVDATLLARTIDMLEDCANTCTQCADSCLSEQDIATLARCIRLNMDCADICGATSRVVARQTEYDANVTGPLLEACIAACRSCADECERHASQMEHCRVCADSCRQCEAACQELGAVLR